MHAGHILFWSGGNLSINMPSYQLRNSDCKDNMVSWPSYLSNENLHTYIFILKQDLGICQYFHVFQDYFIGTGAIRGVPVLCRWNNHEEYG